ncbi:hypothetical protein LCGC14_1332040 [marine sediment metagenome]|uniref:Uncharacterized protein n=1 Tax=marine sediment metagenome TaxID=412755 RepID=A0A0F9L287_9ZZZZ
MGYLIEPREMRDSVLLSELADIEDRFSRIVSNVNAYATKGEADWLTALRDEAERRGLIEATTN